MKKYICFICFIILAFAKVNWKYWSAVPICQHIATNSFTDQTEQVSNENAKLAKEGQLLDWHQRQKKRRAECKWDTFASELLRY